jgi:LCP family protein required for cell wall assembly
VYGKVPIYKEKQKNKDVINILVMGTDSLDITRDRGRSDTMIIVSYNEKTGSIKLTSLLRDALVPISGYDWNRINTAYYFGGVGLAINTVNEIFDLDIQQFVVIDLNGTKNLINRIGGVDITLTAAEADLYNAYWGTKYTAGVNHMEGEHLLGHMRNRSIGSDFERTRRQRDAIVAIFNKVIKEKSVSEIFDLIDYSFGIVKTNIPFSTLTSLATSVLGNVSKLKIESQTVPYADSFKYAWYKGKAIISFDIADAAKRINKFIYG